MSSAVIIELGPRELFCHSVTANQHRVDRHIAHHGVTMAQVASTDPAIAETAIGDNEEDESKVRGIRPHSLLATTAFLSHRNTSLRKFSS